MRPTTGRVKDSKAQGEQIRAVAAMRIGRRIGTVPSERMTPLDAAIRLHLALGFSNGAVFVTLG